MRIIVEANRLKALTHQEAIFQLVVNEGKSLTQASRILALDLSQVSRLWARLLEDMGKNSPKTPDRLAEMRELMNARLESTIRSTYPQIEEDIDAETGEKVLTSTEENPQMLAVRLKAMQQQAELYGLKIETQPMLTDDLPYETPAEIAGDVRSKLLELHSRSHLAGKTGT